MEQARSKSHDQFFGQFLADVARTESVVDRPKKAIPMHSLVAVCSVLSHAGEALNLIKRTAFYGAEFNAAAFAFELHQVVDHAIAGASAADDQTIQLGLDMRMLHGLMGMLTETAGEMPVHLACVATKQPVDTVNLTEERGDYHFYEAIVDMVQGSDPSEPYFAVARKLEKRFPTGTFDAHHALNRDIAAEQTALITQVDPAVLRREQGE